MLSVLNTNRDLRGSRNTRCLSARLSAAYSLLFRNGWLSVVNDGCVQQHRELLNDFCRSPFLLCPQSGSRLSCLRSVLCNPLLRKQPSLPEEEYKNTVLPLASFFSLSYRNVPLCAEGNFLAY